MFIPYQKVRNAVIAGTLIAVTGVAAIVGFSGNDTGRSRSEPTKIAARATPTPSQKNSEPRRASSRPVEPAPTAAPKLGIADLAVDDRPGSAEAVQEAPKKTDAERYAEAMALAQGPADKSGSVKDILGPSSPWKLNLYDDDLDGQYDRGKLDRNRDNIDDEKWNFKQGRWEKDEGLTLWLGGKWVGDPAESATPSDPQPTVAAVPTVSVELKRYRAAMQIASARADRSGKGKDVLGPSSPWKLNLYDDDKDGQWDRAKLDTNRDEIDDEKWNYKKGRWEKDGGATIWNGQDWQSE